MPFVLLSIRIHLEDKMSNYKLTEILLLGNKGDEGSSYLTKSVSSFCDHLMPTTGFPIVERRIHIETESRGLVQYKDDFLPV